MNQYVAQQVAALFPVFRALPDEAWKQVIQHAQHIAVPQGSVIFEDGSPCGAFPLVLSGSVRVIKVGENGRELLLYRVEPGEICMLTSSCMLGKTHYSARGVSESDLSVATLPPMLFNSLISHHEPFRAFVFNYFSERLSELMQLVEEVTFLKLDQRLAALLLAKGSEINSTHQMLADELGSAREVISRLLEGFEAQGMIALSRAHICVKDRDALRGIAHGNN